MAGTSASAQRGGADGATGGRPHVRGTAGPSLPASSELVDARAGTLPLLLSAPHGGIEQPEGVPERTTGLRRLDGRTRLLAEQLVPRLELLLGGSPYVVLARFHRRYLDANRPPE